jgi:hypothetical protein
MLWNPKHDHTTTKAVVFDLPMIIAFLETKNSKGCYIYPDCGGNCLYSQYMVWLGYRKDHVCPDTPAYSVWSKLNKMYGDIAATRPWTYGAALKRAKNRKW